MGLKRFLDIFCCMLGLIIFGPFMLVISFLIKIEDGGDVFFIQKRKGLNEREFECFKFRTMRDGEVTKVGHYLRKTGLDELAQIVNILRGEMSVVGPRPLTELDIERLGWNNQQFRWKIKPGMTGLAQVYRGKGARQSLFLDRKYYEKGSFLFDIQIIILSFMINILGRTRFGMMRDFYRLFQRKMRNKWQRTY